jgi:hypothetical protein
VWTDIQPFDYGSENGYYFGYELSSFGSVTQYTTRLDAPQQEESSKAYSTKFTCHLLIDLMLPSYMEGLYKVILDSFASQQEIEAVSVVRSNIVAPQIVVGAIVEKTRPAPIVFDSED